MTELITLLDGMFIKSGTPEAWRCDLRRSLALVLEYDPSRRLPFAGAVEGVVDFTKSLDVLCRTEAAFLEALEAGSPNASSGRGISRRGFPRKMNFLVEDYFQENFATDHAACGWLTYPELRASLGKASVRLRDLGQSTRRVVEVFRGLAAMYGADRARLVFAIGS